MSAIQSGEKFSHKQLRMLLIEMILQYLEGGVRLRFVLTSGVTIYQQMSATLPPDLLEAVTTLSYLAEHTNVTKPYTFVEHQKIEDQLVTIMQRLQK